MKHYELTYLSSADVSEKVSGFIKEESGILDKTLKPVQKEKGLLTVLSFHLSPEKLENLEKKLKAESQIIRYLLLVKKVAKEAPLKERGVFPLKRKTNTGLKSESKKVDLKEIDQKIEEILKE